MIAYSHSLDPVIAARAEKINIFAEELRQCRCKELPETAGKLAVENKTLLLNKDRISLYVFSRDFWRKKLECRYPVVPDLLECTEETLKIRWQDTEEIFQICQDTVENETYFLRTIIEHNPGTVPIKTTCRQTVSYFPDGPLSDFTFLCNKWAGRKINLSAYPYTTENRDYLATPGNNQLFYNTSGNLYAATAYCDTRQTYLCDLTRDDAMLGHWFALRDALEIAPNGSVTSQFLWFAGEGPEYHIGHLSNVLWRLNSKLDPDIHVPQTDMCDFVRKVTSIWPRTALCGNAPGDHYGAHFFANFFGLFRDGYTPDDQFGCSWLSYDLLKAKYFLENGDREHARKIVDFYCYDHYVGNSRLTYPFHTGKFMEDILPFCERSGWGAPFEPGRIDSLALPEMIYDALILYKLDKDLFQDNYPEAVLKDILKLQQPDGHFRRLYDSDLKPVEKIGWVSQYAESQTWIPVLIELKNITGDPQAAEALAKLADRTYLDFEELGLYSMGGCETDYPCNWDVDGYRTMLWAFIAMYEDTQDELWAQRAEAVQLYCSAFMTGYNIVMPEKTFYKDINWKCRGMIATSFYPHPDYARVQCTAEGNQSVAWHGYLLLKLYAITGKLIYAERGIAAFRQVMIMRDDESLEDNVLADKLRYSIFENNPQMSDESGLYIKGVPQDSYSLFIDLYLYIGEIFKLFGGIYVNTAQKHVLGLDCVKVEDYQFSNGILRMKLRNELGREHSTVIKSSCGEEKSVTFAARELKQISWKY